MHITSKVVSAVKILWVVCVSFTFILPGVYGLPNRLDLTLGMDLTCVSKVSRGIEIPPESEYYIRFDSQNLTLTPQEYEPTTSGLSENVILAIAKSPRWIQPRLTSQFHTLSNPESYANVLLNSSTQYADEIAFSIACCPIGRVPSAIILKENAEALYEHDQWIAYADIVEYDDGTGDYFSTIRYTVLENGTEQYFEFPPEIYYWYVVHPKITTEEIDAVYGPLWRNYLFEHNDLGYPLLKEKISTIQYFWDNESYFQPGARLWNECITQHPTAIEAVSYWIGKTVPYPAVGDRPGLASVIAHEHNGWCGELQKIAIAAQRSLLIPSIAACNVGEDHVWREFYERGWHENDNWWSDTGGAVDKPDVYAYDWGKDMSAVYQWKGDGAILEDTTRYIHEEDCITVSFEVKDLFLQPMDGARIIVLVKGPKDITYYKNLIWEKIQGIWDKLPEFLKGRLLTFLFEKVEHRFDAMPDIIDGFTITIWKYTDMQGKCTFTLGKNRDYFFLIQQDNLKKPWQLARHNTLRTLQTGSNKGDREFNIVLFDVSKKPQRFTNHDLSSGECRFHLSFIQNLYQLQKHFINDGIGRYEFSNGVECFFVDQENFQRYKQGDEFTCYNYLDDASSTMNATIYVSPQDKDWYFIFRNPARETYAIVDFSLDVSVQTTKDRIQIVTPHTSLFEVPLFNIGDTVVFSGIATTEIVTLAIDSDPSTTECPVMNGEWSYAWNTSGTSLGTHRITVTSVGNISDERTVFLIDAIPPYLFVEHPSDGAIVEQNILDISGYSVDNVGIDHVEITLNNVTKLAYGTTTWNLSWDLTGFPLGDYVLTIKAIDSQGLWSSHSCSFVLNESGHSWGPEIVDIYHDPEDLLNTSNVIIYANVTTTGPFNLRTVVLFLNNGTEIISYEMYRYGEYPVQSRHEEDPLFNESNAPLFGKQLGQFPTGQVINYWIVAMDSAGNTKQSEISSFSIQ